MSLAWLKQAVPWPAKIAVKLVLSRLPGGTAAWRRAGLFRHGAMDDPAYAYSVFRAHLDRAGLVDLPQGFTCLELGPGESLFSAVTAKAMGAARTYLVDSGANAVAEPQAYKAMAAYLVEQGLCAPPVTATGNVDDMLRVCDAVYLTGGLSSLTNIPDRSVDLIWSQAVLEHIRRADFFATMRALRRIIKPDGVCSHRVDLRDHLSNALNNLRFSERLWESDVFASSGFYTNRITHTEMLSLFRGAGFAVDVRHVERWPALPTPRRRLAAPFRALPDSELCISGFDVLLRPT